MTIHFRNALIALAVAFLVSFGLGFLMVSAGAEMGFEVPLLGAVLGGFTFYILWNISGNRKITRASEAERQQAVSLSVPAGQALIYVVRTGFVAKAAGMDIAIDGVLRAHLKAPQFTCLAVAPGMHELSAALGGGAGAQSRKQAEQLTVAGGEALGVRIGVKMGAIQGSIAFETMRGHELQQTIRGMKMVTPIAA